VEGRDEMFSGIANNTLFSMPSDIMGRNTTISNMYACSFLAKLTIRPAVQSFQIRKKTKQRSKQLNNKPLYLREKTVNMSTSNVHNL